MRTLYLTAAALFAVAAPAAAQESSAAPAPTAEQPAAAPGQRSITEKITPAAELCSWLIRSNGALAKQDAPGLDLIRATGKLQPPATTGRLEGVYCERDSMVPGEHDDRVPLQLGVPLFINGPTGMTTVAVKDGKFNIAYSTGASLTAEQQQAVKNVVLRWEYRAATGG